MLGTWKPQNKKTKNNAIDLRFDKSKGHFGRITTYVWVTM